MTGSDPEASAPAPPGLGARAGLFFTGLTTLKSIILARLWRFRARPGQERVAVLVTRADIEPANHGAAVKIQRLAAALSRRLDSVFVVTADRGHYFQWQNGERFQRRFPAWLRWLAPPRQWVILKLLLRGFPVSNLFLYYPLADASYARRALWLGRRFQVVLWQAEFPAYAVACLQGQSVFGGTTVLAEHNVEYDRIREQVPGLSDRQYRLLSYWELRLCRACDHVVCVSERDRATLAADGVPAGRLTVIPHGVDVESFAGPEPADLRERFELPGDCRILVFHGTYRYPPNLDAIRFLASEILPSLGGKYRVLAVGLDPPGRTPAPEVRFTGPVDDLPAVIKGADIAVVPLREGGGTRMKVLDYFAARVPVVSSAKGVEGLPLEPGVHYLQADDASAFARAILRLDADSGLRDRLVAAGADFVADLDWGRIGDRYLELL